MNFPYFNYLAKVIKPLSLRNIYIYRPGLFIVNGEIPLSQNKLFLAKFEDTTVEVKSLRVN